MAIDKSKSKYLVGQTGGVFPDRVSDADFQRLEPLIVPDEIRRRHLFGIPLISPVPDENGIYQRILNEDLQQYVLDAVAQVEEEAHLSLLPTAVEERLAYEYNQYENLGYLRLSKRPVSSVEKITISLSNNTDVFSVPQEWIDTANADRGQININPLVVVTGDSGGAATTATFGGAAFMVLLTHRSWVPSYWQVRYTTGFKDGLLPRFVNNILGMTVAIQVLSMLAAADADTTSASLGMDGISQSSGGPGPQKYKLRVDELEQRRQVLLSKLRAKYGTKFVFGSV